MNQAFLQKKAKFSVFQMYTDFSKLVNLAQFLCAMGKL